MFLTTPTSRARNVCTCMARTTCCDMIPGKNMDQTFRFFEASSIRKIKDKYVFIYSRWTNDGEKGLHSAKPLS